MSSDIKRTYDENGYVILKNFFKKESIDQINTIIDEMSANLIPSETVFFENDKVKQIQYLHQPPYHDIFRDIINDLKPYAELLTGDQNLNVLNMQLFEKHPTISKPTRSHQDNAYFRVNPPDAITFWISLDDIDDENGCLYYAPKSHLQGNVLHQRFDAKTTFRIRSGVPGLSLCIPTHNEAQDVPIHTQKGDIVIHHCNLIHRAGKNKSLNRRRRAIGLIYIPTKCQPDPELKEYYNILLLEDIRLQLT